MEDTLVGYDRNAFAQWLTRLCGDGERVTQLLRLYKVGTAPDGQTLFWQTDAAGQPVHGQRARYNPATGSAKDPATGKNTSRPLKGKPYDVPGCAARQAGLFGTHVAFATAGPILVVEAPKTAVVCALLLPGPAAYVATCGATHSPRLRALEGCSSTRPIRILADQDEAGLRFAEEATRVLHQLGFANVASLTLVDIIGQPWEKGADMADVLATTFSLQA